ncbi:MAG: hypothetical protein GY757_54295 [bacterium]|nr:hypothetical protein [bacterium]
MKILSTIHYAYTLIFGIMKIMARRFYEKIKQLDVLQQVGYCKHMIDGND